MDPNNNSQSPNNGMIPPAYSSPTQGYPQGQHQQMQGYPQGQPQQMMQGYPQGQPQQMMQGYPQGQPQPMMQGYPQGQPQQMMQGYPQGQPQQMIQGYPQGQPQQMVQGYPQGQPQQTGYNPVQGYPQGQPQQTGYNPGYQHGGDQKPGQVYPLPQVMPQQPSEKTALLQQGIVQYTPDPNQGPPPQYQAIPNMEGAAQCPVLFDYTVIPDGNLLFPQNCPPIDKPSTVKCNVNGSGNIETYEPALDSDTDELWKFFMSHLSPPKVTIQVNGHHQETRTRTVVRDGQSHMETYQESVQDFNFTFDISPFVSPLWARIACVPIPGQPPKTYKDTLAEYATSKNKLKEIHLEKQANWDYGQISNMIVGCVRATGYPHSIIVTYPTTGNKVHVYASGGVSQLAHNNCVKCLCVVTCLCIIFFPMYYMARKKTSNKIICDYSINLSPMEFYARNYYNIQHHVRRRTFGLVALC